MQRDLEQLERRLEADPENKDLKDQLVVALMRAGLMEKAFAHMKGRFDCPIQWEDHSALEDQRTRHCESCNRTVYFVTGTRQLKKHAKLGHCIAAPSDVVARYERSLQAPDDPPNPRELPHCLSPRPETMADLKTLTHFQQYFEPLLARNSVPMLELDTGGDSPCWLIIIVAAAPLTAEEINAYREITDPSTVTVKYVQPNELETLQVHRRRINAQNRPVMERGMMIGGWE